LVAALPRWDLRGEPLCFFFDKKTGCFSIQRPGCALNSKNTAGAANQLKFANALMIMNIYSLYSATNF